MYTFLSDRDTCTLESLIWSEGKLLSYSRTRSHKNSLIPDNPVCICRFHSVPTVSSVTITSPVCWMSDVFPLKRDNDPFPTCTTDIWKCGTSPHKPRPPPPFHDFLAPLVLYPECDGQCLVLRWWPSVWFLRKPGSGSCWTLKIWYSRPQPQLLKRW